MNNIRLAIIEDDTLVQESLCAFFDAISHTDCVLVASSIESFLIDLPTLENHHISSYWILIY
ncbi:hypothetical protein [uncultured Gelidibacter sp.]|uniref:hypothetical protein n=1 Tax=uncultured Gelidibacter sp. TaxID=259318 RepID=UPI0026059CB0|nr:hypothetical protein [uncultured Gelidibacter sp.]